MLGAVSRALRPEVKGVGLAGDGELFGEESRVRARYLKCIRSMTACGVLTSLMKLHQVSGEGGIALPVSQPDEAHGDKGALDSITGPSQLKISILMCAFNEQQRIEQAISEVLTTNYPCDIELIVVDDGSTDDTALLAEKIVDPRITVHRHGVNRGKGSALRTAANLATGTHILPFDADLEYSSEDIPRLLQPLIERGYNIVYGARIFGFNTVYQSYRYAVGNRIFTRLANVLFDASISDLHTCLKLVPLTLFRRLYLREVGFGLDTELTAMLLRLGIRPFEVPISYYSRSHAQGKKINWRDALVCIGILFRVRARRRKRLFVEASGSVAVKLEVVERSERVHYELLPSLPATGQPTAGQPTAGQMLLPQGSSENNSCVPRTWWHSSR
jgi:dolichol-phosphate hexosyltransferase